MKITAMMTITGPGTFHFTEDVYSNLSIKGNDIIINGDLHTIFGWIHVKGKNIKVNNLYVESPIVICNENGKCEVCGKESRNNTSSIVRFCDTSNVTFTNVNLLSPLRMDYFATIVDSKDVIIKDCEFESNLITGPFPSLYVTYDTPFDDGKC